MQKQAMITSIQNIKWDSLQAIKFNESKDISKEKYEAQKIMNKILNTGNNIKEIETLTLFGKLNNRRIELIKQNNEVYK